MGWFGILPDALQLSQAVTILGHTHTHHNLFCACVHQSQFGILMLHRFETMLSMGGSFIHGIIRSLETVEL